MATKSMTSAQADHGLATVWFINEHGFIATYQAQEQQERAKAKGGRKYKEDFAYPAGADPATSEPLKTGGKDLAAIAYYDDKASRICTRLYYIDVDGILRELCKDGAEGKWYDGALSGCKIAVDPDTTLTAMQAYFKDPNTQEDVRQLRVYYFGKSGNVNVAWATLWKGDWQFGKEIQ